MLGVVVKGIVFGGLRDRFKSVRSSLVREGGVCVVHVAEAADVAEVGRLQASTAHSLDCDLSLLAPSYAMVDVARWSDVEIFSCSLRDRR